MRPRVPFLDLKRSFFGMKIRLFFSVFQVLRDRSFILGPQVAEFETKFAEYLRVPGVVGVGNGTDGLEIALEALGFPPESEVIVPANSFVATAEAVVNSGHKVVFADVRDDGVINHDDVRQKISERTVALIHVHMYGNPSGILESAQLAKDFGIALVEDCAQAHGAKASGQSVGTFGQLGVFSFYPGKVLGAFGDGGAIVFQDSLLGESCRRISNHGRLGKFDHEIIGRNSRLDSIQGAVLVAKLPWLDRDVTQRNRVANLYREQLSGVEGVVLPRASEDAEVHAYHLFVGQFRKRGELAQFLRSRGVQTGVHYPQALSDLTPFADSGSTGFPISRSRAEKILSLPIGPHMSKKQVKYVCSLIREFYQKSENL